MKYCIDTKGNTLMNNQDILALVDHTLLSQTATWEEIKVICDDAIHYQTASVCIPPSYVKAVKVALDIDDSPAELMEQIKASTHSRLPVYRDTIDDITGVLSIRKYLKAYYRTGADTELEPLLDKPHFVHKAIRIDDLLREMSAHIDIYRCNNRL